MTKRSILIISLVALVAAGTFVIASSTRAAGDLAPRAKEAALAILDRLCA